MERYTKLLESELTETLQLEGNRSETHVRDKIWKALCLIEVGA